MSTLYGESLYSEGGALAYLRLTLGDIQRLGDSWVSVVSRLVYDFIKKNGGSDVI
jgi:hypothetical protein